MKLDLYNFTRRENGLVDFCLPWKVDLYIFSRGNLYTWLSLVCNTLGQMYQWWSMLVRKCQLDHQPPTVIRFQKWGVAIHLNKWGVSSLISTTQHHCLHRDLHHKLHSLIHVLFELCASQKKCNPHSIIPLHIQSHPSPHSTATAHPFWLQIQEP